ncbi:MAG TPA: glycosyltransferase family 2 protein [Acidimicrobiales bacterium]|nr:glycosyltransferase family 2 protein [Acidimicrobiales bacterium]
MLAPEPVVDRAHRRLEDALAPVTVIVAAYQAAGTLDQALASVAGQSVAPAEVVVADDGSTDDTVEVAQRWAGRLPLRVLTTAVNHGPSTARHRAVEAATQPLVALLDADDLWLPDHVETLLALYRRHGGVALARFLRWAPGSGLGSHPADVAPVPAPGAQLRAFARSNFAWIATLFERSLYERAGGFRAELRVGEEWDLYIRMVRLGAVIHRAGHPTALYRVRAGSLMWDDAGIDDRIRVMELAAAEAVDGHERRAFAAGRRRFSSERSLLSAYRLASEGRRWAARRAALGTARGHRRVMVRGAAMVVAPRLTERRRRQARAEPSGRLRG